MDKDQFWQIIDGARKEAGDWKGMREPLLGMLSELDVPDIIHWQQILDEYHDLAYKDKLWAAAAVMHNGCSDDGFIDFRGWLIAQGKEVYMNALTNPDSLAGLEAVQAFGREVCSSFYTPLKGYGEAARFQKILSVASYAYESHTGDGDDFYDKIDAASLPDREKSDIAAEINYAPDIDAKWFDWDAAPGEIENAKRRLVPNLYSMFNQPPPPEISASTPRKESVVAKIREAKAEAKGKPPAGRKSKTQDNSGPEL